MASMRKMKMKIPLSFTLEYLQNIFEPCIQEINNESFTRIEFIVYRDSKDTSYNEPISYYYSLESQNLICDFSTYYEMDILKELTVNTNFLNNILTHSPENNFAQIYAKENDLNDVILLNFNKRIARSSFGNILLLSENEIQVPKLSEGSILSVFTNSFLDFAEKELKIKIKETEILAFETQKVDEVLVISDYKGINSILKIRNKSFENQRFKTMVLDWQSSILL